MATFSGACLAGVWPQKYGCRRFVAEVEGWLSKASPSWVCRPGVLGVLSDASKPVSDSVLGDLFDKPPVRLRTCICLMGNQGMQHALARHISGYPPLIIKP